MLDPPRPSGASGPPILLVDDDQDEALLMTMALRRNAVPHEVVVARDGGEALQLLLDERSPRALTRQRPVLVLLDLHMPGMGGLEFLRHIRRDPEGRRVRVLVLTHSRDPAEQAQAHALGADGFLRKPSGFPGFVALASIVAQHWLAQGGPEAAAG